MVENLTLFQARKQVFLKQFWKRKFGLYFPTISLSKRLVLSDSRGVSIICILSTFSTSQQDQDTVSDNLEQQIHYDWQKNGLSASLAPSRYKANFRPFWPFLSLRNKYTLNCNFLQYYSLLSAIPQSWKKLLHDNSGDSTTPRHQSVL